MYMCVRVCACACACMCVCMHTLILVCIDVYWNLSIIGGCNREEYFLLEFEISGCNEVTSLYMGSTLSVVSWCLVYV